MQKEKEERERRGKGKVQTYGEGRQTHFLSALLRPGKKREKESQGRKTTVYPDRRRLGRPEGLTSIR